MILNAFKSVINACEKYNVKGKGKKYKQCIDVDGGKTADWLDTEGE
jgi:hypothetical protein